MRATQPGSKRVSEEPTTQRELRGLGEGVRPGRRREEVPGAPWWRQGAYAALTTALAAFFAGSTR